MYKPPEGAEEDGTKEENSEIKDGVIGQDDFSMTKDLPEVKVMNGTVNWMLPKCLSKYLSFTWRNDHNEEISLM